MFTIAILLGIYSYSIFVLGLLGMLHRSVVIGWTILFLVITIFYKSNRHPGDSERSVEDSRIRFWTHSLALSARTCAQASQNDGILICIFLAQMIVNLVGVLGPELGFDALWYHLTIPKIYLQNHRIFYILGSLLYYSAMPKLVEMLYIPAISIGGEIFAKLVHFLFGILICFALYEFSRKRMSRNISMLVVLVFYSNLVVGWESITAYVDLGRTFFEFLGLFAFIEWIEKGNRKWLYMSALMVGFAIASKVLALSSLIIFSFLIIFYSKQKELVKFIVISLLIPLPWFIFSYIHTGNPFYPFFSSVYQVKVNLLLLNPLEFVRSIWSMFLYLADPISPVYFVFLPLIFYVWKKFDRSAKIIIVYSLLSIIFWYFTPRTGGGRFILPYLPAFSVVVGMIVGKLRENNIRKSLIIFITVITIINIIYRGVANTKYLPVILGTQSKSEFLTKNLNFSYGDFYDTDGYFEKNIKQSDKVLLYGFHNLFYVNFPFIDASYVRNTDRFNYIAVQDGELPKKFDTWKLIYENKTTHVKLYKQL